MLFVYYYIAYCLCDRLKSAIKLVGAVMISFDNLLNITPKIDYYPQFNPKGNKDDISFDGIKALTFESAAYTGQKTKVFAHIGFPKDTKKPVPAVVLVHGGGGHPEDVWIKKWNYRGYAAISMDTTGFFPTKPIPHLYEGFKEGLARELVPPFYEEGYTVAPSNCDMNDCLKPIEDQWMYHAVADVILAHNILRADPRIDAQKIGICGISWGGVITSIAIGYDSRFSFAVPIYSSGYLKDGHTYLNQFFKKPDTEHWYAEKRFSTLKIPVMWLCWNDDNNFSINSNTMSYLDTKDNNPNTCLSIKHQMGHSHRAGYTPEESYWFADTIINGGKVPKVTATKNGRNLILSACDNLKSVRLFYLTQKLSYSEKEKYGFTSTFMDGEWQILDIDKTATEITLPKNAVCYYVEFTLENGIVLSSPYFE